MRLLIRRSTAQPPPRTPDTSLGPCCVACRWTRHRCVKNMFSCALVDADTRYTVADAHRRCSLIMWVMVDRQEFHYDERTLRCVAVCYCDEWDVLRHGQWSLVRLMPSSRRNNCVITLQAITASVSRPTPECWGNNSCYRCWLSHCSYSRVSENGRFSK